MTNKTIVICLFAGTLAGCSSANVTRNPGPDDNGIRYYRPKPYLLVTPADATGRMVKLEVKYLPDYNEEYSIHPKGRKPPAVALKDGWNLVAVGGPPPPPDPAEPAAAPPPPADALKLPEYVVAASNLPIGFYEAVFDSSGTGKYLKGWRYIGFSVWGGGSPNGADAATIAAATAAAKAKAGCAPGAPPSTPPGTPTGSAVQGPLYGIVFFNGAMTFRQIDEIAGNMTCPQYARTIPEAAVIPRETGEGKPGADRRRQVKGNLAQNRPSQAPVHLRRPKSTRRLSVELSRRTPTCRESRAGRSSHRQRPGRPRLLIQKWSHL